MSCSINKPNKAVRIVAGIVIILLGILFESWLGVLGVLPILFATFGYCPLCTLRNISSKKTP